MPREPATYRDNLEDILAFTGGKRQLALYEVAAYLGRDPRTVKKVFGIDPKKGVSAPTLARMLSQ